jgi:hypothetical protein
MTGWTVREDDTAGLAQIPVRQYERMENGRPQVVREAMRNTWWIPHPDWDKGEQRWVTAGEAAYDKRGAEAEAKDKAARSAEDVTRDALGKPEHGYIAPDPERLATPRGKYKTPGEHPFFQRIPMSEDNIVRAYDDASPAEKHQGGRWYEDASRLAWALGGGDPEKGAGVLSAYSPQTAWPANMFNAARALAENRALGPGEGMITGAMQKSAQRVIGGEHFSDVLKAPKTGAFANLLAYGADAPEDELGQVVVDRHALSVAAGRRLDAKDVTDSPIGQDRFYSHVADMYRNAARQISDRDGEELSPHQLQAITWLRQQRINSAQDITEKGAAGKGRAASLAAQWNRWSDYARDHSLRTELGTTALGPVPITADEARGDSRPVSYAEFHDVATRGRDLLDQMEADRSAPAGLVGNWDSLKDSAWQEAQKPWGGMTIDAHSGEPLAADADKFALTVKPPGIAPVSVPEDAGQQQFAAAMDEALVKFRSLLEQSGHYLAVFHDDDSHRIDIDPVVVTDSRDDAEAIGAYTHNTGGAYNFKDGSGYWPPHVQE